MPQQKSSFESERPLDPPAAQFRVFTEGTEKAAFTPGLHAPSDPVVEGRYTVDAFEGSDLATTLDRHNIRTVFLAGFITDQCIAKIPATALDRGYDAYVLADLTATYSAFVQWRAEREFGHRVITSSILTGGPVSTEDPGIASKPE